MKQINQSFFQYSTITALVGKSFEGSISMNDLLAKGSFGIGTFDSLDGELIIVDKKAYQMLSGGVINAVTDKLTSPFATVFNLQAPETFWLHNVNYQQLETILAKKISSLNQFYAYMITGEFTDIMIRVIKKQTKPYPSLTKAAESQEIITLQADKGNIVGFWTPDFAKTIGVKGFHSHFINEMRNVGGHVLNFTAKVLEIKLCSFNQMELVLPNTANYLSYQIDSDTLQSNIEKAESIR